jgi:pyrroloquinoline quinone biosynthesis protein B
LGRLTAIVIGSAAGGGFPQWNCLCATCRLAWSGDARVRARTQASLAVTGDGESWVLINASPDLPQQIRQSRCLHPCSGARASPIKAVVLTGAEIDQITGLLSLRERERFALIATAATHQTLASNPVFAALARDVVTREVAVPGEPLQLPGTLRAELFAVPGKVPLYLESPIAAVEDGSTIGIEIIGGGARIAYVPGAADITSEMIERLARVDVVLFDGTLFRDDEMITIGVGTKTGRRMGHVPIHGEGGSLTGLASIRARRIFVHINNTNPILVEGSPERLCVERSGWEVAEDGMEIVL